MRLGDVLRARVGETMLATLGVLRVLCCIRPMLALYRRMLVRLVRKTALFDARYYRENNPDIAESQVDELFHYVAYGDREGRAPMAFFDPPGYRKSACGWTKNINALLHFSFVGRFRRLSPSPWFDVGYYLANNKDVARAGIDPLLHYLTWGGLEGRSPCAHFDGAYYLRKNPDVEEARVNPLLHYLVDGRFEGRRAVPACDPDASPETEEPLPPPVLPQPEQWLALESRALAGDAEVDVIVPVYKGKSETLRCIYSVLSSACQTRYELVVIDDASPDAELAAELQALSEMGLFSLLRNSQNRGFVHTVNAGMLLHKLRDVVLLNSDTEVYDGWLDRLVNSARSDKRVGTVTPLSNNATICSYPRFLQDNPFPLELDYRELDALVASTNTGISVAAPTGVGFCMYIKRVCLQDVGLFDEQTFGRGYGEENDFCQRAIANGWRNLIAADIFVRHWGSVSFQGEKARLAGMALKLVEKRHPNYLADVSDFIKREPLADIYQRIDWARLLRLKREQNVLLVSHGRGGGTERRVQEDVKRLLAEGFGIYLMRPVPGVPGQATISHPATKGLPNLVPLELSDLNGLKKVVEELQITEVYSHSFVDFAKDAPLYLKELVAGSKLAWRMHLHDYEVICPRINLVDDQGRYCGEPDEAGCNRCLALNGSGFDVTDIRQWRERHKESMLAASRIIVPDDDVADRLARYHPQVEVEVLPHEPFEPSAVAPWEPVLADGERLRVVVIGAIGKMKGFNVLLRCARTARKHRLPIEFVLLGYSLDDKALEEAGVHVSGKYEEADAVEKLHELKPHVVWLPSLWPETYSYTLSIAIKAGYPALAFDIGAIARRMRVMGRGQGVMPLALARDEVKINDYLMRYRNGVLAGAGSGRAAANELEVAFAAAFD